MFIIGITSVLTSCMTNEKKALKIIDNYMKGYLYVYDSYRPQTTKIDTAYYNPAFDATVLAHAKSAIDAEDRYNKALRSLDRAEKESNFARSSMAIWSDNYSAYSKEQYNQALKKYQNAKADIKKFTEEVDREKLTIVSEENLIKEAAAQIPADVCGWLVQHSYTCKTRGGHDTARIMIFVINKDFSEILFACDNENEEVLECINRIKTVLGLQY